MSAIPHEKTMDGSLSLLRDGNLYITRRCNKYQTDIFRTRLLFKKTFCIRGEDASKIFYGKGRLTRRGAMPPTVLRLLQDKGSVATLDDEAHHWRKQMMMSLMTPGFVQQLVALVEQGWRDRLVVWQTMNHIDFFAEIQEVLCGAVCEWCGISLTEEELIQRSREISAMIDGAGAIGLRNWRGMFLRRRTEKWLKSEINEARKIGFHSDKASPLQIIAAHQDTQNELLPPEVAAVEVLNLIRPTVAVGRFILFAAIALHEHPQIKQKLLNSDEDYLHCFVQEVRRFYPFFPFISGIVRGAFKWGDCYLPEGARVMLDVYGTNHDPRIWEEPERFNPERFRGWQDNAFSFVPQGGGSYFTNHRCAGEELTIALMKRCIQLLLNSMKYEVIAQDTEINMQRMPALPNKPFFICRVEPLNASKSTS